VSALALTFTRQSEKITSAKGWAGINGVWVDHDNMISSEKNNDTSMRVNFYWMQSATFNYKDKKYYAFYYETISGRYKYPLTEQDWITNRETPFLIMNTVQYAAFKLAINSKSGKNKSLKGEKSGDYINAKSGYDETSFLNEVAKAMENSPLGNCFCINSQTLKGNDIVRFLLPTECVDTDFDTHYFEVPTTDFKKLLID
jgi:hypothetical protein